MLGVQPHAAADECLEVDAVTLAGEAQLDAVVAVPDGAHPVGRAGLVEDLDRALLEDAGADGRLDLLARAGVDHDRLDAGVREQVREQQACGAGADDRDAGADGVGHVVSFDGDRDASPSVARRSVRGCSRSTGKHSVSSVTCVRPTEVSRALVTDEREWDAAGAVYILRQADSREGYSANLPMALAVSSISCSPP